MSTYVFLLTKVKEELRKLNMEDYKKARYELRETGEGERVR